MNDVLPVKQPLLDGNERRHSNECIHTGWISWEGPFVKRREEAFAARVGRKYAIAVHSPAPTGGRGSLCCGRAAMGATDDGT